MTYTFFSNIEGTYILYDSASGAVIKASEPEAYICEALDPCGEALLRLPEKCPSDIRYELARFSSTEVNAAYAKIKEYYTQGLIFGTDTANRIRISGLYSANDSLISAITAETGISKNSFDLI